MGRVDVEQRVETLGVGVKELKAVEGCVDAPRRGVSSIGLSGLEPPLCHSEVGGASEILL